jgi:hypothetical protein
LLLRQHVARYCIEYVSAAVYVQVSLVSLETFAVVALPAARGAVAVCAQASSHLPVLLAAALRAGKGRSKVVLFSMLPGATTTGSSKEPAVMVFQVGRGGRGLLVGQLLGMPPAVCSVLVQARR